jgi:hypothetical protein
VFVVDDLVGWLITRLADAGYKKLITRLRGSDQQRALKEAVTAAVQVTVREIGLSGGEEADRAAEQINKAFRGREPVLCRRDRTHCWRRCRPGSRRSCLLLTMRGSRLSACRGCLTPVSPSPGFAHRGPEPAAAPPCRRPVAPVGASWSPAPGPPCAQAAHRSPAPRTPTPTRSRRPRTSPKRADDPPCRLTFRQGAVPTVLSPEPRHQYAKPCSIRAGPDGPVRTMLRPGLARVMWPGASLPAISPSEISAGPGAK